MAGPMILRLNSSGMREMLKSSGVMADLVARAERVAQTAGPGMEASSVTGKTRARASVITATTEARYNEASGKTLTRAFGQAAG
jgi:hypothetical protein